MARACVLLLADTDTHGATTTVSMPTYATTSAAHPPIAPERLKDTAGCRGTFCALARSSGARNELDIPVTHVLVDVADQRPVELVTS